MTIKQQGGIFGRNPTFNDVDIEGTLTVNGEPISDFGTMAQQDATSVNIDGGAVDGVTLGTNSAVTEAQVDNINLNGNTISTSSANLTLTPTDHVFVTKGGSSTATLYLSSDKYTGSTGDISSKIVLYSDNTAAWTGTREMVSLDYIGNGADHRAGSLSIKVKKGAADANPTEMLLIDGVRNTTTIQSGNLAFPSGAGIDFSATAGTGTSELFDDYEEGTWTPAITFGGGNTGVTYSVQSGNYTKIGNLVTITCYLVLTSKGTSTGNVKITGLPFSNVNFPSGVSLGRIDNISFTGRIGGNMTSNATTIDINETTDAGVISGVDDTNFSNSSSLYFSTSYHTS